MDIAPRWLVLERSVGDLEGQGLPELRRSILDHITRTRGVSASPEQMFIVPSTQVAPDLLSRVPSGVVAIPT